MGKAEVQETVSAKPKKQRKCPGIQKKTERIDDMVDELKQNHSSMYTVVQTTVSWDNWRHDSLLILVILQEPRKETPHT